MHSLFRLPWGQGLHFVHLFFSLPWGQGVHAAQSLFSLPCGHGLHTLHWLFCLPCVHRFLPITSGQSSARLDVCSYTEEGSHNFLR